MGVRSTFNVKDTHGVLQKFGAHIGASSEGLGWSSAYASMQRERPFNGRFQALSDSLMVLHRGGPVDVTFKTEGRAVSRHVPKGGIFFLPAGHECDVLLHSPLDTIHIYLRSSLFKDSENESPDYLPGLAPIFGECDAVLEHLASAICQVITDNVPGSSLFVDPIAKAIASRFVAINYQSHIRGGAHRSFRLTHKQLQRINEFVEENLDTDIRLNGMSNACNLSTEYFVRLFKTTMGISPYQYVLSMRVQRAQGLLTESQHSLAEIALECGFSHQEHMTRIFRRFTGTTPGRYRRNFHPDSRG
jgi:AraC family transcriptional regulator